MGIPKGSCISTFTAIVFLLARDVSSSQDLLSLEMRGDTGEW